MKKLILSLVFLCTVFNSYGQNSVYSSKPLDNISIGVSSGFDVNLRDWRNPEGSYLNINLNKAINPYFGLSTDVGVGFNNTSNFISSRCVNNTTPHEYLSHFSNSIENLYVGINGNLNMSNIILGYNNKSRKFEILTEAGLYYAHTYVPNEIGRNALIAKIGAITDLYLNNSRSLNLRFRPSVAWDFNHAHNKFNANYGIVRFDLGIVYHFKTSNGYRYFKFPKPEVYVKEIPVVKEVIKEEVITRFIQTTYVVTFAKGSYIMENVDALDSIPEGSIVDIVSYSSPEGNKEANLELSELRALSVRDYLHAKGVKTNKIDARGADTEYANRIAIVSIIKYKQ